MSQIIPRNMFLILMSYLKGVGYHLITIKLHDSYYNKVFKL